MLISLLNTSGVYSSFLFTVGIQRNKVGFRLFFCLCTLISPFSVCVEPSLVFPSPCYFAVNLFHTLSNECSIHAILSTEDTVTASLPFSVSFWFKVFFICLTASSNLAILSSPLFYVGVLSCISVFPDEVDYLRLCCHRGATWSCSVLSASILPYHEELFLVVSLKVPLKMRGFFLEFVIKMKWPDVLGGQNLYPIHRIFMEKLNELCRCFPCKLLCMRLPWVY